MVTARRRRRRHPARWLLLGGLLTVVVLLTDAALSAHPSPGEHVLAYFDQVRPQIQSSVGEGADLNYVRVNAVKLGRDGITRGLDRLTAQTKATLTAATAVIPPAALRVSHAYLLAALGVRAKAAADARMAMALALSEGPADPAAQRLASVGQLIALSDQSYGLFAESLPANPATPPPPSRWALDPSLWTSQEVAIFVTTLRSSTSLSAVHDLAVVTFSTEPAPVGDDGGAWIIPPTRGMQVAIVVADVGNLPERHATVTATLFTNGANTTQSVRDFVDLVPGQRVALTIGSLHPVSGTTGLLTAAISVVPGETSVANNSVQQAVALR
jgi:hypothetical protein